MPVPFLQEPTDTTKNKILVADDDEVGRLAICRILEREGFSCTEAQSGADALRVLASSDIALVVTDIKMEGNTRLELLDHLSRIRPRIPAILITGHPTIETAAAATTYAAAYLLKPLDPQELIRVVQAEFGQKMLYSSLQAFRRKQEDLARHMRELEAAIDQANRGAASEVLQTYACLAIENAVDSLLDLKPLLKAALGSSSTDSNGRLHNARPLVLINAIQEAIQVIDRTRQSFKSKELASLRHKLEALLKTTHPEVV